MRSSIRSFRGKPSLIQIDAVEAEDVIVAAGDVLESCCDLRPNADPIPPSTLWNRISSRLYRRRDSLARVSVLSERFLEDLPAHRAGGWLSADLSPQVLNGVLLRSAFHCAAREIVDLGSYASVWWLDYCRRNPPHAIEIAEPVGRFLDSAAEAARWSAGVGDPPNQRTLGGIFPGKADRLSRFFRTIRKSARTHFRPAQSR